jgi:hypothetical protein
LQAAAARAQIVLESRQRAAAEMEGRIRLVTVPQEHQTRAVVAAVLRILHSRTLMEQAADQASWLFHSEKLMENERLARVEEKCSRIPIIEQKVDTLLDRISANEKKDAFRWGQAIGMVLLAASLATMAVELIR